MYSEESEWIESIGVSAFMPLWNTDESHRLEGKKIGISISDIGDYDYSRFHLHPNHAQRLS